MAGEVVLIDPKTGDSYKAGGGTGTAANQVQGTSASGAADDGSNPVKIGSIGTAVAPTAVASGSRVNMWLTVNGAAVVSPGLSTNPGDADPNTGIFAPGFSGGLAAQMVKGFVLNPSGTWDRQRGDTTGTWVHSPPSVPTSSSNTIAASGGTAAVTFTNTSDTEVFNPSTATLWASWGTPAVNGAGSFPIIANGSYRPPSRVAGTLTLLSTAANQPYTSYRYA